MMFERALHRYADRIYGLALIREPQPRYAARATVQAFTSLEWHALEADEHIEERLIAALPPVKSRRLGAGLRRESAVGVPATFWKLRSDVRLALALRWSRGYSATVIAQVLQTSPDSMHSTLENALNDLARLPSGQVEAACRSCRWSHLDGLVPARGHLLVCTQCRDVLQRWEQAEHELAQDVARFTNAAILPQSGVDALRTFHERKSNTTQTVPYVSVWQRPMVWRALVVVGVLVVVAGLIFAPNTRGTVQQSGTSPRELLVLAVERYGAAPEGDGVLRQRFALQIGEGGEKMQADVWTDASDAARHRMQLTDGDRVREWQVGDGVNAFRYSGSSNIWTCVPLDTRGTQRVLDVINRWPLAAAEQRTLRERRWQFGPWAIGQRYIETARTAERLRSLGVATENGVKVATISAEGEGIDGSLMLKLDVQTGDLREVREIHTDNGMTRIFTPWRLLEQERISAAEAKRIGVFFNYPTPQRPDEVMRPLPLIDTSCPSWQKEYTFSLSSVLSRDTIPLVGLPDLPAGIDRIYLGGQGDQQQNPIPESLVMIYAGPGHRLTLRTDNVGRNSEQLRTTPSVTAITSGDWRIWIRQRGLGWISGIAQYIEPDSDAPRTRRTVAFYAEGWNRDEVITILGTARQLQLDDWRSQRSLIYDPDMQVTTVEARRSYVEAGTMFVAASARPVALAAKSPDRHQTGGN